MYRHRSGEIISRSCSTVSELIGRNRNEYSTLIDAQHLVSDQISIIGRNFETHEDTQGFYRPADAALDGAGQGAWFGGLFGLMLGAMGFFVMPVVGAVLIMGSLADMIAGAIGGAGAGASSNCIS